MAKSTKGTKAPAVRAAQSRQEAEELLAEIGQLQRQVTVIETKMNKRLAEAKEVFELEAQPLNAGITEKFEKLQLWAEAHRDVLCVGGAKTAKLATGELSWRLNPPSVRIQAQDMVVDMLKALGLFHLLRTKEEVNKEGILADPAQVANVKGITIKQDEVFVARPFESEIERAATSKRSAA